MPAAFHRGVILGALEGSHAVRPVVKGSNTAFLNSEFDIAWE